MVRFVVIVISIQSFIRSFCPGRTSCSSRQFIGLQYHFLLGSAKRSESCGHRLMVVTLFNGLSSNGLCYSVKSWTACLGVGGTIKPVSLQYWMPHHAWHCVLPIVLPDHTRCCIVPALLMTVLAAALKVQPWNVLHRWWCINQVVGFSSSRVLLHLCGVHRKNLP